MFDAKNRVLQCLEKNSSKVTITTAELAEKLGLSRSVVSHYLNDLVKEDKIVKLNGRPVKWQKKGYSSSSDLSNAFSDFIGYRGSMRKIITQVSAAVVYPPNGLNILITGHSGVGKSYLASKISKYAKEAKAVSSNAPYIVLNCADYANNPELISSMLFGYVKGAYTGADESKEGLLSQANGGYLFLDEVHRLSSENQEKLFSFIDSGEFYKMGDNAHAIKSTVRLIMATTENPESSLLETFLRRIPVRVNLPDFIQRPIDERFSLLQFLFYQEAKKISKKIDIDSHVVSSLLQLNHGGNIGYLKNIIQVSCATAYHDQLNNDVIHLRMNNLLLSNLPIYKEYGSIFVNPEVELKRSTKSIIQKKLNELKNKLHNLAENYNTSNLTDVNLYIESLNKFVPKRYEKSGLHLQHKHVFKQIIESQFGLQDTIYFEEIIYLLYKYHFQAEEIDIGILKTKIESHLSRSFHVANIFYNNLDILTKESHESLVLVLAILLSNHIDENIQLRGLMVAHGENTATSIQTVVNSLCSTYIFDAIDMSIDTGVDSIIEETNKLIDSFNTTNGFILMVDMGSLSQLYSAIKTHLDGDLLIVNNLTTLTGLDLALKMQQNIPFKAIAEKADKDYKISVQYYEGFSQSPNILISCISGLGIAEKVSEIVQPFLPTNIKVIPIGYQDLKEKIEAHEWNYFNRTLFVLTTVDIVEPVEFNHMNLYDLLDSSGETNLKHWLAPYLTEEQINCFSQQLLRFFSKEGISERLSFLNPDIVISEVEIINSKYESFYQLKLDGKVKLNLYMHIALMIERLIIQKGFKANICPANKQEEEFFRVTKNIFKPIEVKYNIQITNYEVSLLYELFQPFLN